MHSNSENSSPARHRALEILEDLIRIQSVNPGLEAGARGEAEMADYVEAFGRRIGAKVTREAVLPGRDNVLLEIRAGKPDNALLFESHMDTVSLGSMVDPLTPKYENGKLYGRGSCDTKATMAGMLYALECAAQNPSALAGDVLLLAAIDEELNFRGIYHFAKQNKLPLAGAVIGEPTEMKIVIAHKGIARFKIHTHGKAAHSAVPHEGNSAIFQMMEVLAFLREKEEARLTQISHPLTGHATIVAGTIQGGTQINIVPEHCEIQVDRRVVPGENADEAFAEFQKYLQHAMQDKDVNFSVEELLLDGSLNTSPDAPIAQRAQSAARKFGLSEELIGVPYGTDASKLQEFQNIPCIVFGPGSITKAHTKDEYVPVDEVAQAAEFYRELTLPA